MDQILVNKAESIFKTLFPDLNYAEYSKDITNENCRKKVQTLNEHLPQYISLDSSKLASHPHEVAVTRIDRATSAIDKNGNVRLVLKGREACSHYANRVKFTTDTLKVPSDYEVILSNQSDYIEAVKRLHEYYLKGL